jgi:hypothetical protein
MAEDKKQVNVMMDIEIAMMLDSMVYEANQVGYETDRSKFIRGLIKKEFAKQHPEVVKIEEMHRPADSQHVIPVVYQQSKTE